MTEYAYPAVAIVGLSGAFPGAASAEALWPSLEQGMVGVRDLDRDQLRAAGVPDALLDHPDYVAAAAMLDDHDCFDAEFFGFSPRDAALMDPQHRLLLEHAHAAIENAGYRPSALPAATGVYVGIGHSGYLLHHVQPAMRGGNPNGELGALLGNDKSYAATRIAHRLNLRGPALAVDTACSTSLVAVHVACNALLGNECDVALAGGARVQVPAGRGYLYMEGSIYSATGRCAPFDARATGTIQGSGVGVVVLKRLEDALADGDCIRAVIRATAVNNDGAGKIEYTAPSVAGQADVIEAALALAGIDPADIGFVETHGTGTALGDPIEIAALERAFRRSRRRRETPCLLGALKANLGHLDVAAGVASLIRTIGVLESGRVPPLANFERANPQIDFDRAGLQVPTEATDWPVGSAPRIAAVSSFGIGGTNAHVVLEQAPSRAPAAGAAAQLLLLSARSPEALAELARRTGHRLPAIDDIEAVAHTLQCGRDGHAWRGFLVADSLAEAGRHWCTATDAWLATAQPVPEASPRVLFQFPGQGTLPPAAAAVLYRDLPLFREVLDEGLALAGEPVRRRLLDAASATADDAVEQVALVLFEYTLARTLQLIGVHADALTGHSLGEYTAAALAGVCDLPTLLRLVHARGEAMAAMPPGSMLSLATGEADAEALLGQFPALDLAAVNSPQQCVLSGPDDAIDALERDCQRRGLPCRRLATGHAFHSRATDAVADRLRGVFAAARLSLPSLTVVSNLHGAPAGAELADGDYWLRHLRAPVRYSRGLQSQLSQSGTLLLEVGPGQVLTGLARQHRAAAIACQGGDPMLATRALLQALGQLWQCGFAIDFAALYRGQPRRRAPLPGHPFERTRHWLDTSVPPDAVAVPRRQADAGVRLQLPCWTRAPAFAPSEPVDRHDWLLIGDRNARLTGLADALRRRGAVVDEISPDELPGDPDAAADWNDLLLRRAGSGERSLQLVFVLAPVPPAPLADGRLERMFQTVFVPLLRFAAATEQAGRPARMAVLGSCLADVHGHDPVDPLAGMALGAARVLSQEHPGLAVRLLDVDAGTAVDQMLDELLRDDPHQIALRGGQRFREDYHDLPVATEPLPIRAGGRYLLLGGLGAIGRQLARRFAAAAPVELILTGRTELPAREHWSQLRSGPDLSPELRARLDCVDALEAAGSRVQWQAVPLEDADVLHSWLASLGRLDGIVHAAGLPAHGLARGKSAAAMREVLAAKLVPLAALESRLDTVDFVLLCSSVAARTGGLGQADYAAANACLELAAHHWQRRARVLAIGWDEWRDTGMAARAGAPSANWQPLPARAWPLAARFRLQQQRDWLLDEHRLGGIAVLPGTGSIELLLAGIAHPAALRDLHWLVPARADAGGGIDLQRVAGPGGDGQQLELHVGGPEARQVHVTACRSAVAERPAPISLPALQARCRTALAVDPAGAFAALPAVRAGSLQLGARWRCLQQAWLGDRELLGELQLDPAWHDDLVHCRTHPALLDVAAGVLAALLLDPGDGLCVPASVAELQVYAALPARFFSWIRPSGREPRRFDVDLLDDDGAVLLQLRGFQLQPVAVPAPHVVPAATPVAGARALDPEQALAPLGALLGCRELGTVLISRDDPVERRVGLRASLQRSAPAVGTGAVEVDGDGVEPLHQQLAARWASELGRDRIALDDDFFALGGNSLSAMQVAARVRDELGLPLAMRALFEYPTLRRLADHVRTLQPVLAEPHAADETGADQALDAGADTALSLQQQRLWFLAQMQGDAATYNVPVALALNGELDLPRLIAAIGQLHHRHDVLLLQWQPDGDALRQQRGREPGSLRVVDLEGLAVGDRDREHDRLVAADARQAFRWLGAPLHRLGVIRRASGHHTLCWCLHHAICDHWSIGLLLRDLLLGYHGRSPAAPARRYRDYVRQQRTPAAQVRRERGLEYWRRTLADAPPLLELPTDFERPQQQSERGAALDWQLPVELVAALEDLARRHSASLYMVLLAGFKALLHGLTGQRRIVVGTPVANRDDAYRDVVGFFANTVAIHTAVPDSGRFSDLLAAVRDSALGAFEHQDVPFEQVVEAVVQRRSLAHAPLVQVVFVLQNAPTPRALPGELAVALLDQRTDTAKFDLVLALYQNADGIRCRTEFRTDLLRAASVQQLLAGWQQVLERVVEDADVALNGLLQVVAPASQDAEIEEFVL